MKNRLAVICACGVLAALASTSLAEVLSTFEFTGGALTPTMDAYATGNSITVSDLAIGSGYGDLFDNGSDGNSLRISGDDGAYNGTGDAMANSLYLSFSVTNNSGDTLSLSAFSANIYAQNTYQWSNARIYSSVQGFDEVVADTIGKIGRNSSGTDAGWAVQTLDLVGLGNPSEGANIAEGDFLVANGGSMTFYIPWVDNSGSDTRYTDVDDISISGTVIGEEPPVWNEIPIEESGVVGVDFAGTLAGKATDPNLDTITYSRDSSGPAWLSVADTGELTGVPDILGTNVFKVVADDGNTTPVTNTLNFVCREATPAGILIDNIIRNGSFEDGGTNKLYFKDGTVNSWQTWTGISTADNDTGASVPVTPLTGMDGTRRAYFQPGGAVLNMTDYIIQEGDVIDYSLWNLDVGRTASVEISLVWDNDGSMDVITGTSLVISNGTQGVGTTFTVQAGDAWIGKTLGLGIADDLTDSAAWPGCDQAYLKVVAEVSDPVSDLVITGPINNGTQMVLSWTGEPGGSYSVQTNSNLAIAEGWKDWLTDIDGIGTPLSVTNDIGSDQLFYQVITE